MLPTLHGEANPSGRVTDECFARGAGAIVAAIAGSTSEVDGVLLALHGAMVTDS